MILRETSKVNSSKGIDAMTTAHHIDWDGVMYVAADFAEKSWLLARRPGRRRFSTPACFLWEGSPCMLNATTFVGEYVRAWS